MSKQELFDKVVTHLLTQNEKSTKVISGIEICAYRGNNGLMCAVGCLIPDEIYNEDIEGLRAVNVIEKYMCNYPTYLFYSRFLEELQYVHDSMSVDLWKDELISLAKKEGLQFNEPI